MELPASPLVLTKLRLPALRPHLIPRARLVDLLTPENGASFILVCAPAGYGKTTLLSEWGHSLLKNGASVAWYALDPGDNDPIPFKSYLVASFIQALGPVPELTQIAQLLRSLPEMDLHWVLPSLINAIVLNGQECVLILDDYHLVSSPAIHSAIGYLLEHLPENLRIAIGSRSDPPLSLARLRARRQLLAIRSADLRFTLDETEQFVNQVMQLDLSNQGIAVLEDRTEGWIAGLQLAALSLSERVDKEQLIASFTGSHRYLVEYLLEEVVNRQPEEVQSFLLITSILERLNAGLCDAVVGRFERPEVQTFQPSHEILEYLERSNLFVVALDDQGDWYRYHHLFRDFLQTRLNKTYPGQSNSFHRAACEWLAAHGYLRDAAGHAFQVQDWEYPAAFVEQHSFTLILHSDISTIYEWCSSFPEEVMQRRPMLCLLQGLALAYGSRRQNRDRVKARLQQVDQWIAVLEDRQVAGELSEFAGVVRTFLAFVPDPAADPQELLALAQGMLSHYPKGNPGQFTGLLLTGYANLALHEAKAAEQAFETARQIALHERLYFGIVDSSFHLARLALSQGQLRRATEICHQGRTDLAALLTLPDQELPALGCLDIILGAVSLEQDRLDEAEGHLRHGLELMGGGMNPYYVMTAYLALYRLSEIQGRRAEALKYLDHLEAAWPDLAFCTRGLQVMSALRISADDPNTLAKAAQWSQVYSSSLGDDGSPPGMGPFGAAEAYYLAFLAWVRTQVALGYPRAVFPSLERQLALAETHSLTTRVIELYLLEAQAAHAEGDGSRTWVALERALRLAQPEGFMRIFDQGPGLTRLLVETKQRGIFKEYIDGILTATGMGETLDGEGKTTRSSQTPHRESLSERELEVLRMIAQGATNQEIAEKLVITVGTVKSHINHVLGKLDAHNRTEAVARARGLGLLEI